MIEIPIEDAPAAYLEMKNHDLRLVIDKVEFEQLQSLYTQDKEAFLAYKPSKRVTSKTGKLTFKSISILQT